MTDWAIGLSTGSFYQVSFFDILGDILGSGFSVIEIGSNPGHLDYHRPDQVKRASAALEELGLFPLSYHAPFSKDIDITSADRKRRSRSMEEILLSLEAAALLGARNFVLHPGPDQEDGTGPGEYCQRLRNAAEALNIISARCGAGGISLILENLLPHLILGQSSDILWLLGAINSKNVGFCLDTGHGYLSGDLDRQAFRLSGHLKMLHVHDNNGKGDLHLPPGRGDIAWYRLLAGLKARGFRGSLIMELSGTEKPAGKVLEEAREGRSYLRKVLREI
jgi:sugar phosphate isomerase/epimerase